MFLINENIYFFINGNVYLMNENIMKKIFSFNEIYIVW